MGQQVRVLLRVLIFQGAVLRALGCSFPLGYPEGPFLQLPLPQGSSLLRSTTDENILGGSIARYGGDSYSYEEVFDITIDLNTGSVSEGEPDAQIIAPQEPLADTTGGYELERINSTAILTSSIGDITVVLEAPDDYEVDDESPLYYFVSNSTGKAYLFYETSVECTSSGVPVVDCVSGGYRQTNNGLAIVDLATEAAIYPVFSYIYGIHLNSPGPFNSFETVYDSVQVAQLGYEDSCGGKNYIFFTDDSVLEAYFPPGAPKALLIGDAPEDLTVFDVRQHIDYGLPLDLGSVLEPGPWRATKFEVRQVSVATGEVLRMVELDKSDIDDIAGTACVIFCFLSGLLALGASLIPCL